MRLPVFFAALLAAPALAAAEVPSLAAPEILPDGTQRWSFLVTYGDEQCPPPQDDEIIVCARLPESERYRIPEPLRDKKPDSVGGMSWASHVESYDNVARLSRPNSCSSVGSNGWTGCAAQALRDWFAERRLIAAEAAAGDNQDN